MPELEDLKSKISAAKEQKKATMDKKEDAPVESMDMEQVEKIVSRMKKNTAQKASSLRKSLERWAR